MIVSKQSAKEKRSANDFTVPRPSSSLVESLTFKCEYTGAFLVFAGAERSVPVSGTAPAVWWQLQGVGNDFISIISMYFDLEMRCCPQLEGRGELLVTAHLRFNQITVERNEPKEDAGAEWTAETNSKCKCLLCGSKCVWETFGQIFECTLQSPKEGLKIVNICVLLPRVFVCAS